MKKKKVVIGLSGGVDSSVAAYLLKQEGYEVIGLFMKNWHDKTGLLDNDCPWLDDKYDAMSVAKKLGIAFNFVDFSKEYKKRVIDYMFSEYKKGRTPNPDILCNREIKFDVFLQHACKIGADYVATGHYCRVEHNNNNYTLLAGKDKNKDQSYFLCQLNQEQLKKTIFPIGNMEKKRVREIAQKLDVITANKKDSQGICFVGKIDLPIFLQQKLKAKEGNIIEIPSYIYKTEIEEGLKENYTLQELQKLTRPYYYTTRDGEKVGSHNGAHFYTIGQRKGLDVGGTPEPLFIIATDIEQNSIYVGQGRKHQGLFRKGLFIQKEDTHWINSQNKIEKKASRQYSVRVRYRQELQKSRLFFEEEGVYIIFDKLQRGIAAGQFAAWYEKEELIGSGVIFQ